MIFVPLLILRTTALLTSEINKSPCVLPQIAQRDRKVACLAGPSSPVDAYVPLPATVEIIPT